MENVLELCNIPRLNCDKTENLNRLIVSEEIETIIKNPPKAESPRSDIFTGKFYQTFKEDLIPILLKIFQKIKREGMPFISFYEACIILITKPGSTKRESWPISVVNIDTRILNKIFANQI